MDRRELIADLAEWSVDYEYRGKGEDRKRYELPDVITQVMMPFTGDDWMEIAMREGRFYVGGCCGNMSYLQDIMNTVFRDGGWASSSHLIAIGEAARDHDGFEWFEKMDDDKFSQAVTDWRTAEENEKLVIDPWGKLGITFNALEPYLKVGGIDRVSAKGEPKNPNYRSELAGREIDTLYDTLSRVWVSDLFGRDSDPKREDWASDEAYEKNVRYAKLRNAQHDASRHLAMAKLLDPARTLVDLIETRLEPLDGFAMVEKGTDKLMHNGNGECVFTTREAAEYVVEVTERLRGEDEDAKHREPGPEPEIVPVHISVENGLEIQR